MAEEKQINVTGEVDEVTQDYIATINELKQNSVDRSKYEQLRAEHKKLLDSIVNGQELEQPLKAEHLDVKELREKLFNSDSELSNLEYIDTALKLRKTLIESGQPDPFLPIGNQIMPTDQDIQAANRVAEVLQECVDYAEGDSDVFTNELQRRTIDVKIR
jgi:hypothetical protein